WECRPNRPWPRPLCLTLHLDDDLGTTIPKCRCRISASLAFGQTPERRSQELRAAGIQDHCFSPRILRLLVNLAAHDIQSWTSNAILPRTFSRRPDDPFTRRTGVVFAGGACRSRSRQRRRSSGASATKSHGSV